jgi:RIP metalloprotease RseP
MCRVSPKVALPVTLERGGKIVKLTVTPAEIPDGSGRIGVSLGPNAKVERTKASSVGQAFALATKDFLALSGTIARGLGQIVSNFQEVAGNVSGPVAILAVGSEVARTDSAGLFQFAALLNINLAAVNILPLPALDGKLESLQVTYVERFSSGNCRLFLGFREALTDVSII